AAEIVSGVRAALLINGPRIGPDPEDFISETYRELDFNEPAPFVLSRKVIRQVYATRKAQFTNDVTPVICIPFSPAGKMCGVLYVEGQPGRCRFDEEQVLHLSKVATIAETLDLTGENIKSLGDTIKAVTRERDHYKEEASADWTIRGTSPAIQR